MFVLKTIYEVIKGILASIGLMLVTTTLMCLYTNYPEDLFNKITVEQNIKKADAIVVLGAGVTQGGWPGKSSMERIVKGVILYKQGMAPKIIIAGGWEHDGYIAAAQAMAKVAEELGVNKDDIIVEDQSKNTYENIVFSIKIMKEHNMKSAILVTSESHMKRGMLVFSKLNFLAYPAPVEAFLPKPQLSWRSKIYNFNILYQVFYETAGILKYKINGWV